jgi:uncharacterized protein DUF4397
MNSHSILSGWDRVRRGVIAAAAAALIACGTKEATAPLEPSGPTGRIRFVNLINDPARNPVNAILEKLPFGVNIAYTGSTPSSLAAPNTANYSAILTGDRSLVLKKTADTSVTVASFTLTIADGVDRTLYAIGGAGGGAVTSFSITDDNSAAIPAGQVRVRVVNMSPATGAIDAFVTAPNADLSTATPVASGVAPQVAAAYVNIGALGTYQFRAVPAGTAPANRAASVIVNITPTAPLLAAGTGRTFVVADKAAGGSPPTAFVLTDQ